MNVGANPQIAFLSATGFFQAGSDYPFSDRRRSVPLGGYPQLTKENTYETDYGAPRYCHAFVARFWFNLRFGRWDRDPTVMHAGSSMLATALLEVEQTSSSQGMGLC